MAKMQPQFYSVERGVDSTAGEHAGSLTGANDALDQHDAHWDRYPATGDSGHVQGPSGQRDRGTRPMPERNNMMGHHISVRDSGSPVSNSNHLRVHSHCPKGLLVKTLRPTGMGWTVLHPNSYVEALTSSTL